MKRPRRRKPRAEAPSGIWRDAALARDALETAAIPMFLADADGVLVHANRAFGDLLGYDAAALPRLDPQSLVHADDVANVREALARLARGATVRRPREMRFLRADGTSVWVLTTATTIRRYPAPLISVQAIDIEHQKRAEAAAAEREQRWNVALESAGQGVWDHDSRKAHAFYSRTWKEIRGLDTSDSYDETPEEWMARIHPDDLGRIRSEVERQGTGDLGFKVTEYRERHADGHWIWILSRGKTVDWNPDGTPARMVGTDTDITSLKAIEESTQFANTVLTTAMETSPDAILVIDDMSRVISFNTRFVDMWRVPKEALAAGADAPILASIASALRDPEAFNSSVRHLREHPEDTGTEELETIDRRTIERNTGALRLPDGRSLGRVWFFRDITERKAAQAQILWTARSDALTGLANRVVFMEELERAIARTRREGSTFAVLYLDLDRFKDVNDTMGHPVGDELLKAVAGRLRSTTRPSDIVARFGGDEFAVLATGTDADGAAEFAARLIKAVGAPFQILGDDVRTHTSIGISLSGPSEMGAETMLTQADLALYRAKSEGSGGFCFFTEAMDSEARTRVTLGSELREAIASNQLFLVYQPQVEVASGVIVGVEALVRWRHPSGAILSPAVFIPVAERNGLIAALGRWVLREACSQMKAWRDAGLAFGPISVNLSAIQFKRPEELERDIVAILSETGLPPSLLELELTETVLMTAAHEHNDLLRRLRSKGVRLAIDDFGTGYSSFNYLRLFPADRIKIAQVFVDQITTDHGCAAIVRATLGLARELGIDVIAEGVETQQQADLLQAWGCKEAQGYHYSRPVVAERIPSLLVSSGNAKVRSSRTRRAA
jgi:diguanylate cyclase (GGDEF)-like protein/PAS domain S-box-containing protein